MARRNAARLGLARRVEFVLSDLFADVGERPFDLVVSNPPYIPADEYVALEPNVRDYEPRLALYGGVDGLDFYRRLVPGAALLLRPGGTLALEVGAGQADAVAGDHRRRRRLRGGGAARRPLRHAACGVRRPARAGRGGGAGQRGRPLMARAEKARAVVLSSRPLGEADRIVRLFTRELGRVDAVVKGVRKTTSRWGGRLEPFNACDLVLHPGRSLYTVTQAQLVDVFARLRADREGLSAAAIVCEAAAGLTPEHEPEERVFALLRNTLRELDRGISGRAVESPLVLGALLKLLYEAGYLPVLEHCAACGSGGRALGFSAGRGGLVCGDCAGEAVPITPRRSTRWPRRSPVHWRSCARSLRPPRPARRCATCTSCTRSTPARACVRCASPPGCTEWSRGRAACPSGRGRGAVRAEAPAAVERTRPAHPGGQALASPATRERASSRRRHADPDRRQLSRSGYWECTRPDNGAHGTSVRGGTTRCLFASGSYW